MKVNTRNVCVALLVIVLTITSMVLAPPLATEAQDRDPVLVLQDMDKNLIIGQRARGEWGHFWSAPAVTGINLGYLAEHGYPKFVSDLNGNGEIDSTDLVNLVDTLGGEEYMDTNPDRGTLDPNLLRGLAKYVSENYPDSFEIKIYENNFRGEYGDVFTENFPDQLFGIPLSVFTDPEFPSYEKELRDGEMIWLGLPQENTDLNHFLAGRSFDTRENLSGNFPVDFADPKEESFQPGKGQIIETEMTPGGELSYNGMSRPIDIMLVLSPLEETEGDTGGENETITSGGPNFECSAGCEIDCDEKVETTCVESETTESECTEWTCDGVVYDKPCNGPGDQCCDGFWECEERAPGETTCLEYEKRQVTECSTSCDFSVENTGDETANPHTDKITVYYSGSGCDFSEKSRKLWWQSLQPGADRTAEVEFEPGQYCSIERTTCEVDIFDTVEETKEEDNKSESNSDN
jgi:hypothetical protein